MTGLHPQEWPNFLRASIARPWHLPRLGLELGSLITRRVVGQVQQRRLAGTHIGVKIRPSWLDAAPLQFPPSSTPLTLPPYPARPFDASWDDRYQPVSTDHDPEAYFAQHRWVDCVGALGGDSARVEAVVRQALDWIASAPLRADRAWEPYSTSERVVNLAVLLAARPVTLTPAEHTTVCTFVTDSLQWIDARLEFYGSGRTNNHILNNARALVVGGVVVGCAQAAARGLRLFEVMIPELFGPDGCLRERSSHYQVIVTQWLLDARHFARAAALDDEGRRHLGRLDAAATTAAAATAWLRDAGRGRDLHIGDISPDMTPAWSNARLGCLYPDAGAPAPRVSRLDDWIAVDAHGQSIVACLPAASHPDLRPTHGHQDLGAFVWLIGDTPVLVDTGRSHYTDSPATRVQLGPDGHNSLVINGFAPIAASVLTSGRWCPEPYAHATVSADVLPAGFVLRHDGFARVTGVGAHQRHVTVTDDALTVEDQIDGTGAITLETYWQFPPGAGQGATATAVTVGEWTIDVTATSSGGARPDISLGPSVCASAYGREVPGLRVRHRWQVSLPCTVQTTFRRRTCAA